MELKDKYRRFSEWKEQPHQVAPLSEEEHECPTCGTRYEGNYCPRCGQSCKIGRYSFKNALLLYLDVWGVGNRGMFRSIRDLLLRPGYMIRDYLRGMQMAYFPPFKMFFLLVALSLAVDSGLNIQGINRMKQKDGQVERTLNETFNTGEKKPEVKKSEKASKYDIALEKLNTWIEQHSSAFLLILLLLFTLPLYLLFRHSPAIPDLRLTECFVAMVYIENMLLIYGIVPLLLCFSAKNEMIYGILTLLLAIIPVKQLTGYSYPSTIWRLIVAFIPFAIIVILVDLIAVLGIAAYTHCFG